MKKFFLIPAFLCLAGQPVVHAYEPPVARVRFEPPAALENRVSVLEAQMMEVRQRLGMNVAPQQMSQNPVAGVAQSAPTVTMIVDGVGGSVLVGGVEGATCVNGTCGTQVPLTQASFSSGVGPVRGFFQRISGRR